MKPQLKPVPPKEPKLQSREVKIPIKLNSVKDMPPEAKKPPLSKTNSIRGDETNIEKVLKHNFQFICKIRNNDDTFRLYRQKEMQLYVKKV